MAIRSKDDIRVYNECPFQTNLVGQNREYVFPPCVDEPTMNFINFDDIEYAHSRSKQFSIGLLVFDENDQDRMYEALGIKDWKNKVWFNKDIEDVIINPTLDKMQKVIDTKDLITLERIRGKMVYFVNQGRDVSQNVINIVNSRYRELTSGVANSKIVIRPADVEKSASSQEVNDLKKQLADMQKLMEKMVNTNNTANTQSTVETKLEDKNENAQSETRAKKPSRRASTKK